MNITLLVELVVAVLLIGTFGMCLALNRRLGNLRANQDEMRRLIGEFDKALSKARVGMADLKAASAAVDGVHEERMKQAKALREELGFMIETAERLADRLAGEAAGNRSLRTGKDGAPQSAPVRDNLQRDAARRDGLVRETVASARSAAPDPDLGNADRPFTPMRASAARPAAAMRPAAGAQAAAVQAASQATAQAGTTVDRFKFEPRSEAERELLMALRQAR
ncbi:DUF6468 domain-containing protein [Ferrovibrio sp.]|uniref:DUF6468 domain-containing protein n=1 Tax=Ferrovibrio sp. TaxID=1917215 RepID=UPI0035B11F28